MSTGCVVFRRMATHRALRLAPVPEGRLLQCKPASDFDVWPHFQGHSLPIDSFDRGNNAATCLPAVSLVSYGWPKNALKWQQRHSAALHKLVPAGLLRFYQSGIAKHEPGPQLRSQISAEAKSGGLLLQRESGRGGLEADGEVLAVNLEVPADVSTASSSGRRVLKDMSFAEMERFVVELGEQPKRARHLWRWLYHDLASHPEDIPLALGMGKAFRQKLAEAGEFKVLELVDIKRARDGTSKLLFRLPAGSVVEAVLIPASGRNTLCVSSQVGCAMNCQFCFTGRMGLLGNLSAAEIVEQLVIARRMLTPEVGPITNVVFMGMGEPLHNIDNVLRAVDTMVDLKGLHLSPRKVTVSTSGLVPQIQRFCRESSASLAVSLNATTDEVRNWIMPINRKYNLEKLLSCLRQEYPRKESSQARVMLEYVMLRGINDSLEDAQRLIELVQGLPCQINLITFNGHKGSEFMPSSKEQVEAFFRVVAGANIVVTRRESRGDDEMAACGQLGQLGEAIRPPPRMRPPERFKEVLVANAAM